MSERWHFHKQHRSFILIAALFGFYHPGLRRVISSKFLRSCVFAWCSCVVLSISYVTISGILGIFYAAAAKEVILPIMAVSASGHTCARWCYLVFNAQKGYDVIEKWESHFMNDDDKEKVRMREFYVSSSWRGMRKTLKTLSTTNLICLMIYIAVEYLSPDKTTTRILPFFHYEHKSPDYELVVTSWAIPMFFQPLISYAMELTVLTPLYWEAAELSRLSESLSDIFKDLPSVQSNNDGGRVKLMIPSHDQNVKIPAIERKFKTWIMEHQELCRFHEMVQEMLTVPFTFELLYAFAAAFIVPLRLTDINLRADERITSPGYYAPCVIFFKMKCNSVDTILEKSSNLFYSALNSNWSVLPNSVKKSMLIAQLRIMQRPLTFRAFKHFQITNRTFMALIRLAYTVANVLMASMDDKA